MAGAIKTDATFGLRKKEQSLKLVLNERDAACNECLFFHQPVTHSGVSNPVTPQKQNFSGQLFCLDWYQEEIKGLVCCSPVQSSVRCFLSQLVVFSCSLGLAQRFGNLQENLNVLL